MLPDFCPMSGLNHDRSRSPSRIRAAPVEERNDEVQTLVDVEERIDEVQTDVKVDAHDDEVQTVVNVKEHDDECQFDDRDDEVHAFINQPVHDTHSGVLQDFEDSPAPEDVLDGDGEQAESGEDVADSADMFESDPEESGSDSSEHTPCFFCGVNGPSDVSSCQYCDTSTCCNCAASDKFCCAALRRDALGDWYDSQDDQ